MATHEPRILLTGFEPFGGEPVNPSWLAVSRLHGECIDGHRVEALLLPTCFGASIARLEQALQAPCALVLGVGQAGGRAALSLERVAINVDDARIADNAGCQPVDTPVVAGGPAAYFATLPLKAMLDALHRAGIPAEVSQSAGTYVCNHLFYGLMHALRARPTTRGGFMHIPFAPEQAAARPGTPSMAIDMVVAGLQVALATALATHADIALSAGAEH
jgi:pyroglutamyl-peptidase